MRTDIIATLGSSCQRGSVLMNMVKSGMTTARLNFSHENEQVHSERLKLVKALNSRYSAGIRVMLDLKGHEVRIKYLQAPLTLEKGEKVMLSTEPGEGRIVIGSDSLLRKLRPGMNLLMDDGYVELVVGKRVPEGLECKVADNCVLKPGKSVATDLLDEFQGMTEEDRNALKFARENSVDSVAVSHVGSARLVEEVRQELAGTGIMIVSKIENSAGLRNLREIMVASDAIMVARGDLGINLPLEKLPAIQERIMHLAASLEIPAIVATQMLESMTTNSRPTRAEVNDVYLAIRQGASGILLSGETAIAADPARTVAWARKIASEAEAEGGRLLPAIEEVGA